MSTPDPETPKSEISDDDGGAVGSFMQKALGKSWKTTIAGAVSFICGIAMGLNVALPGQLPPLLVALAAIIGPMVGGVGLMMAKDHNVSGGTKKIPPPPSDHPDLV